MSEMAYAGTTEKQGFLILAEFDEQLGRLEANLDALAGTLNPVLESEGPESMPSPEEAPIHDLHNSILRLRRYNTRLDSIRRRIKL